MIEQYYSIYLIEDGYRKNDSANDIAVHPNNSFLRNIDQKYPKHEEKDARKQKGSISFMTVSV